MSAVVGKPFSRSPSDWDCPACRNVNFARRDTCNRCQTPRPPARYSAPYPVASQTSSGRFQPQAGDWTCSNPSCGNINWAKRVACNRCGTTRTAMDATFMEVTPGVKPGDWPCAQCGNINWARREECNLCHTPRAGGPVIPATTYIRTPQLPVAAPQHAADWPCPSCGNINFARRDACNRCAAPRPMQLTSGVVAPSYGAMAFAAEKRPFKMLKDDWVCPSPECGNVNFGRRTACNRCGAPKA